MSGMLHQHYFLQNLSKSISARLQCQAKNLQPGITAISHVKLSTDFLLQNCVRLCNIPLSKIFQFALPAVDVHTSFSLPKYVLVHYVLHSDFALHESRICFPPTSLVHPHRQFHAAIALVSTLLLIKCLFAETAPLQTFRSFLLFMPDIIWYVFPPWAVKTYKQIKDMQHTANSEL